MVDFLNFIIFKPVWFITYFAEYKVRHTTTSSDKVRNTPLENFNEKLASIRLAAETYLAVLRRLEGIASEVKDESGDVFVIQRRPRSSITGQHVSISREK